MVSQDKQNGIFWVDLEQGLKAKLTYTLDGNVMSINSTKVPEELQGRGCGKIMMEAVLPEVEAQGFSVIPVCSYVVHYFNKNPQWQHLLAAK